MEEIKFDRKQNQQIEDARETLEILYEISQILNTKLDKHTLSILVSLCDTYPILLSRKRTDIYDRTWLQDIVRMCGFHCICYDSGMGVYCL